MTLQETIKTLEYIAINQPNLNNIVESGDIFDLNKEEYEQKYSVFCATQGTHSIGIDFSTYNFTLFYVDRLTLDKSNKIEIHSTAVQFFQNFLKTIMDKIPSLNVENGEVTTFTERFSAECAGAYMRLNITTPNISLCSIIKNELGEFVPEEFSDDYFKWVFNYLQK